MTSGFRSLSTSFHSNQERTRFTCRTRVQTLLSSASSRGHLNLLFSRVSRDMPAAPSCHMPSPGFIQRHHKFLGCQEDLQWRHRNHLRSAERSLKYEKWPKYARMAMSCTFNKAEQNLPCSGDGYQNYRHETFVEYGQEYETTVINGWSKHVSWIMGTGVLHREEWKQEATHERIAALHIRNPLSRAVTQH